MNMKKVMLSLFVTGFLFQGISADPNNNNQPAAPTAKSGYLTTVVSTLRLDKAVEYTVTNKYKVGGVVLAMLGIYTVLQCPWIREKLFGPKEEKETVRLRLDPRIIDPAKVARVH